MLYRMHLSFAARLPLTPSFLFPDSVYGDNYYDDVEKCASIDRNDGVRGSDVKMFVDPKSSRVMKCECFEGAGDIEGA